MDDGKFRLCLRNIYKADVDLYSKNVTIYL